MKFRLGHLLDSALLIVMAPPAWLTALVRVTVSGEIIRHRLYLEAAYKYHKQARLSAHSPPPSHTLSRTLGTILGFFWGGRGMRGAIIHAVAPTLSLANDMLWISEWQGRGHSTGQSAFSWGQWPHPLYSPLTCTHYYIHSGHIGAEIFHIFLSNTSECISSMGCRNALKIMLLCQCCLYFANKLFAFLRKRRFVWVEINAS